MKAKPFCEKHQCMKTNYTRRFKDKNGEAKIGNRWLCEECHSENCMRDYNENKAERNQKARAHHEANKEEHNAANNQRYYDNRDAILAQQKQKRDENKEEINKGRREKYATMTPEEKKPLLKRGLEYYEANKEECIARNVLREKTRRKEDSVYRLRRLISVTVRQQLKKGGGSKGGKSVKQALGGEYFYELNARLEELFSHPDNLDMNGEVWMTKDNQGLYKPSEWDDADPKTWRWNEDHIKPLSKLPCATMDHPNFKEGWNIDNLRPLSAKQNVTDGNNRTDEEVCAIKKSIIEFLGSKKAGQK